MSHTQTLKQFTQLCGLCPSPIQINVTPALYGTKGFQEVPVRDNPGLRSTPHPMKNRNNSVLGIIALVLSALAGNNPNLGTQAL